MNKHTVSHFLSFLVMFLSTISVSVGSCFSCLLLNFVFDIVLGVDFVNALYYCVRCVYTLNEENEIKTFLIVFSCLISTVWSFVTVCTHVCVFSVSNVPILIILIPVSFQSDCCVLSFVIYSLLEYQFSFL